MHGCQPSPETTSTTASQSNKTTSLRHWTHPHQYLHSNLMKKNLTETFKAKIWWHLFGLSEASQMRCGRQDISLREAYQYMRIDWFTCKSEINKKANIKKCLVSNSWNGFANSNLLQQPLYKICTGLLNAKHMKNLLYSLWFLFNI